VAPKRVDPADLLDAHQVAALLGLASPTAVGTYRSRYDDFPEPILPSAPTPGKCFYWLRSDVQRWRDRHPALAKARDGEADPS
jgi:predicted DNA-binding transcriptional regulator AlpA